MTSKEEIAWMAGFFDGEGSVYIKKYKPNGKDTPWVLQLAVSISNTVEAALKPFKAEYEGSIVRSDVRMVYKPEWVCKPIYKWILPANKARRFLEDIEPYLKIKGPHARLAIEFQKYRRTANPPGHPARESVVLTLEAYRSRLKEMNR